MLTPLYPVTSEPATILVVAPGALAGETEVPVSPLSIDLASGFILSFDNGTFAKLAAAAVVDDDSLTTAALPTNLVAGIVAEISGSSAGARLSQKFVKLASDDERQAVLDLAAQLLGLTAGYEGDDAKSLSIALVEQVNYLLQRDYEPLLKRSIVKGSPSQSEVYRDRYLNPDAAVIVARVTSIQQVRFAVPMAGM